jgi:hypothetical protein
MANSFYFQHDYNSANDVKVLFLRQQLGIEGYGIFWFIIEQLAQAGGILPLKIIPVLAMQIQTSADKVASVIKNYDLFTVEEDEFFSTRLLKQLEFRNQLSEDGKRGALKRWSLKQIDSPPISHPISDPNAKERKGKKRKERKEINIPSVDDFLAYSRTLPVYTIGYEFPLKAKYNSWVENGWKDGNGNSISNWKTKIQNTFPHLKPMVIKMKNVL